MNSCLADLSRLIPPQYQRKGRGRIEKTEIIEMAIRHLKHLQNECVHKEIEYKMGYTDCMKETAKFLYDTQMQDLCYQLLAHLQEHCDEIMKNECYKTRCNVDSISASSGSPPAHNYHPPTSLAQLRDMIPSDVEHSNSNDHNDVKDLSFRSQPHQAPVITSTAPPSVHHESSNHDFESSREPICHQENGIVTPPPLQQNSILRTGRTRNISESSHEVEHNNNYKYKNHIKQRFNQDSHLHDESTGEHSIGGSNMAEANSSVDHPKTTLDQTVGCKKRKISGCEPTENGAYDEKALTNGDIKSESPVHHTKPALNGTRHFTVPIFALHGQGTYYVPLNIDYDALLPYLHGVDLLDKNYCSVSALHPINISVNFSPSHPRSQSFARPKLEAIANGW
ncbi:transcription factor cwo isoform X2 [Hermetia illucens]|nr:transcription factor cwo isoform X2 [Hermetia illucens]XP_037913785.1 transcription factor cwo isoform X2 [Hermetia illucens]